MRGAEIVSAITWHPETDPDTQARIEQAIAALDRKAFGNGQPVLRPMDAERRLRDFIKGYPSNAAAARALGISRGTLYDVQSGRRTLSPRLQKAIGVKRIREPELYEET
ncbi:MAG: hypothetical protein KJ944_00005 [Alphaproteobacteria bacterium]|nr:hypothetical protein [Alphaproteobacteria bacterium]MBU1561521.1 hypothetical protein [Alphaproteobacteria bacterium]MBU2300956.1 hypothetical protein [Alphaproteobacteria bacterium]MBU2368407.1 hypothetical protein [Alphaproteobacteria bacterium]